MNKLCETILRQASADYAKYRMYDDLVFITSEEYLDMVHTLMNENRLFEHQIYPSSRDLRILHENLPFTFDLAIQSPHGLIRFKLKRD